MTPEDQDKALREMIAKVLLPPDLCPSDPDAIEAMLDAAGSDPLPEDQVERILKKARGQLEVGERKKEEAVWSEEALTEEEKELVALHRNQGGELPPEITEKLRRLREKAKSGPAGEEDCDDKLEP